MLKHPKNCFFTICSFSIDFVTWNSYLVLMLQRHALILASCFLYSLDDDKENLVRSEVGYMITKTVQGSVLKSNFRHKNTTWIISFYLFGRYIYARIFIAWLFAYSDIFNSIYQSFKHLLGVTIEDAIDTTSFGKIESCMENILYERHIT